MPTAELIGSADIKHQAALQWRLSIPLMVLIVTLLAVPLSRTNPRQGRYAKVLPAMMLYFAYLVLLNAMRGALESGSVPIAVTLLPVHLLFLLIAALLLGWDRIKAALVQRSPPTLIVILGWPDASSLSACGQQCILCYCQWPC